MSPTVTLTSADTSRAVPAPCEQRRADRHRPLPQPDRILAASVWVRGVVLLAIAGYGYAITH